MADVFSSVLMIRSIHLNTNEYWMTACLLFTIITLLCSKKEQGVTHLGLQWRTWLAQSPDLNVIEHMWSILKKELEKKNPKTTDELYNAAKDIWKLITNQTIRKLFESLPSRTKAVVNARSGNTKY